MDLRPLLIPHSVALIEEFKEIFSSPIGGDVRCVDILIFREALPFVPFYIYFVDRFKGPSKTHKPIQPLNHLKSFINPKIYDSREEKIGMALDRDEENPEQDNWSKVYEEFHSEDKQLASWISICWLEANVSNHVKHAYCHHEDQAFKPINLKTGKELIHVSELSGVFDG